MANQSTRSAPNMHNFAERAQPQPTRTQPQSDSFMNRLFNRNPIPEEREECIENSSLTLPAPEPANRYLACFGDGTDRHIMGETHPPTVIMALPDPVSVVS